MNPDIIMSKFVLFPETMLLYVIQFAHNSIFICEMLSSVNKSPSPKKKKRKEEKKRKKQNKTNNLRKKKSKCVTFICDTKSLLHNLRHAVLGPRFPL